VNIFEVDSDEHQPGFCLEEESTLRVVRPSGQQETLIIDSVEADALLEDTGGRAQVGRTPHGEWVLVRELDDPAVRVFRCRSDLGRFLWDEVFDDPISVITLFQLGMLRLDLDGSGTGGE
jgi:hypothetical protein